MSEKRSIFEEVGSNPERAAAVVGAISRGDDGDRNLMRIWLRCLIGLIVAMITVGGLTRLTDSGLSITEWDPVMGALPPLSTLAWTTAFDAYKMTAEYTFQNMAMTLPEFKIIFWWEWAHRQLGRFIGLFLVFWFYSSLFAKKNTQNTPLVAFYNWPFYWVTGGYRLADG
jgi:cytochrome c oxidase assembly protein subunit 15